MAAGVTTWQESTVTNVASGKDAVIDAFASALHLNHFPADNASDMAATATDAALIAAGLMKGP